MLMRGTELSESDGV